MEIKRSRKMPVYIYSMYKKVAKYNKTKMKFLKIER